MSTTFKVDTSKGEARMELSREWAKRPDDQRFLSLGDLDSYIFHRFLAAKEGRMPVNKLSVLADKGELLVQGQKSTKKLTNWSFRQLCHFADAPAQYLSKLPEDMVMQLLNHGFKNSSFGETKVLVDETHIRAFTGPTYGRVWDAEVLAVVSDIAKEGQWKIPGALDWSTMIYDPHLPVTKESTTLYASDRDVWLFLVDDLNPIEIGKDVRGNPDYLFRGFYCANSEVGLRVLEGATFYLRGVCCNRIMWGVEQFSKVSIKHTSGAPKRFATEFSPTLRRFGQGAVARVVAGVRTAKDTVIATSDDEAKEFLAKFKLSGTRIDGILEVHFKEEQHPIRSAWDAAQGITAFARDIPYADQRFEVESVAKLILDKVS